MTPPKTIELQSAVPPLAGLHWQGDGASKILALHGWLDNAASFCQLAEHLEYADLYAMDFPGHGHSSHYSPGATYHFVDWVFSVSQMLAKLGGGPIELVAHSMGAAVSSLFCGMFPDRIRKLVLIEGLAPLTEEPEKSPDRLSRHLQARMRSPRDPKPYPDKEAALAMRLKATPMSEVGARHIVERSLVAVDGGGFTWRSDKRLTLPSAIRMTEAQVISFLKRVTCPTLIIKATSGLSFDPQLEKRLLNSLPQASATLETIDGGHHIHCDAPEECASIINNFLKT